MEQVVYAWKMGESAEGIVESFPTLELADVYATIAYYLRHREQVEAYLEQQERESERLQQEIEARFPKAGLRERLLARLNR